MTAIKLTNELTLAKRQSSRCKRTFSYRVIRDCELLEPKQLLITGSTAANQERGQTSAKTSHLGLNKSQRQYWTVTFRCKSHQVQKLMAK